MPPAMGGIAPRDLTQKERGSGKGLKRTVKQVTLACDLRAGNNPQAHAILPSLLRPVERRGTYLGEDWQFLHK